jgi:hypothetical protein
VIATTFEAVAAAAVDVDRQGVRHVAALVGHLHISRQAVRIIQLHGEMNQAISSSGEISISPAA